MNQVNIPGVGPVNFPDGMSDEDITKAIETDILPSYGAPAEAPVVPVSEERTLGESFGAGIDLLQGMGGGFAEASGQATGIDWLEDFGRETREENLAEIGSVAPKQGFSESETFGDYTDWASETLAEQIPLMAPGLVGAIGGGMAGTALTGNPLGGLVGGMIGAFVPSFVMGTGEVQMNIAEKGGEAPAAAFIGGSAIAALDSILPGYLGSKLLTKFGKEAGTKIAAGILTKPSRLAPRVLKGAGVGAATEAPTEAFQEVIGEVAAALGTDTDIDWEGLKAQAIEAGAAGALMGGTFGGAFSAPKPATAKDTDEEDAPADDAGTGMQTPEAARSSRETYLAEQSEKRRKARIEREANEQPLLALPDYSASEMSAAENLARAEAEKRDMFPAPKLDALEDTDIDQSAFNEADPFVSDATAELSAEAQAKNIRSRPDEEIFSGNDIGKYGAQVAGYYAIRQPGKDTYSVNDLKAAGLSKEDIDTISQQKDDAPAWASPDATQTLEIRGKAIAKSKGYGWKSLVRDLTGQDSLSKVPLAKMNDFFAELNALDDKSPGAVKKRNEERANLDAEERDALNEGNYQKIMDAFREAGTADPRIATRSKDEGGLGMAPGEVKKVMEMAEKRRDVRSLPTAQGSPKAWALKEQAGPKRQATPVGEVQDGQEETLRVSEVPSRVEVGESGDGWTYQLDDHKAPYFKTRGEAIKSASETAKSLGVEMPPVFRGRKKHAIVQDIVEDGKVVSTAPVQVFDTQEEALDAASLADGNLDKATAQNVSKQQIKARRDQRRKSATEAKGNFKALVSAERDVNTPEPLADSIQFQIDPIRAELRKRMEALGLGGVGLQLGRFNVPQEDPEGRFKTPQESPLRYTNGIIQLAVDIYAGRTQDDVLRMMTEVLDHEMIHALKVNGAFTEQQWKTLLETAKKRKVKLADGTEHTFWGYQRDVKLVGAGIPEGSEVFQEEVVADMFRYWAANGGKFPGAPASIFRKIANMFKAIADVFLRRGIDSSDQIFKSLEKGEIAAQSEALQSGSPAVTEAGPTMSVDDEYAGITEPGYVNRLSRPEQQMYEYQLRRVGKDSLIRRVMASSPADARVKANAQMKRTKGAFEVSGIKEWSSMADQEKKKVSDSLPEEAKEAARYSRRMVADMTNVESQAEFDTWFKGAELQDKDGNPIVMYRGTRGSILDEDMNDIPSPEIRINDKGMSFFSFDPKFTEMFSEPEIEPEIGELPRTIPVIINSKKIFNPDKAELWTELRKYAVNKQEFDRYKSEYDEQVSEQDTFGEPKDTWYRIENAPEIMRAIRSSPFDSLYLWEDGYRNVAVFDPKQVKSVFNKFEEGAADSPRYSRKVNPLAQFIQDNPEGFTISVDGKTAPQTGYVLAPLKQTEIALDVKTVMGGDMSALVDMVTDLQEVTGQDAFAGGWLNQDEDTPNYGKYVLDAVFTVESYEEAVYTALAGDQDGIFSLDTFDVIKTGEAIDVLKQDGTYSAEREYDARAKNQELSRRFEKQRAKRTGGGGSEGNRLSRISPRYPTAKNRVDDPTGGALQIGAEHVLNNSKVNRSKIVKILKSTPGFVTTKRNPEAVTEEYIDHLVGNLLFIYDSVDPDIRQRSKLWYEGARKIIDKWKVKYNLTDQQIAGVLAALSPQKDWYQNVSLAERVLDIQTKFTRGNMRAFMPPPEMYATAEKLYMRDSKGKLKSGDAAKGTAAMVRDIMGRPYEDITDPDPSVKRTKQAMWIRTYDQTYNDRSYRTVSPEGLFVGDPAGITAWGSNSEIGKAAGVLDTTDPEEIAALMGKQHKVRSFFNNMIDPLSLDGDITADTHAVAAAQLRALSGNSSAVHQNFGSSPEAKKKPKDFISPPNSAVTGAKGLYGINADAYRKAARLRGVLPREMQSITWEAVRGLFEKNWKNPKNAKAVDDIWHSYEKGDISLGSAREQIVAFAGGIDDPTWLRDELPSSENDEGVSNSSYAGELSGSRLSRRTPRGVQRGGAAPSSSQQGLIRAPNGTMSFGLFAMPGAKKPSPVNLSVSALNHITKMRQHTGLGEFSHLDNFIKYTPAQNERHIQIFLEELLKAFNANPDSERFTLKRQMDGNDERYVIEWTNPAVSTSSQKLRLVMAPKPSPVGPVMEVVTFFPKTETYSMEASKDMRFSRVPEMDNKAKNNKFATLSFNLSEGLIGKYINEVGNNPWVVEQRYKWQDSMFPVQQMLTRMYKELVLEGKTITSEEDGYVQETLMHGALGDAHDRQLKRIYKPILKRIAALKVTMDELGEYLTAMHAKERNAYVESIGGEPGGSGIANPDAHKAAVIKKLQASGKLKAVEEAAKMARDVIANTNEIRLKAGLISREQYDAGMAAMPNYIPLRGKLEENIDPDATTLGGSAIGRGVEVRGSEDMRITGRKDIAPAKDILAHIIGQNMDTLSRAYKAKVGRAFYTLAKNNPDRDDIRLITEDNKRDAFTEVANVGGKIIKRVKPGWKNQEDVFWTKVGGRDVGIQFPGNPIAARALRNADNPADIGPVTKFMMGFNRFLANVNTSWNPEFILTNLARDLQTAAIMINQTEVKGLSMAIVKDVPKALVAVREVLRNGTASSELARSFEEMKRAGGTTEYLGINDMELISQRFEEELKEYSEGGISKSKKMARTIRDFFEDYNRVAENATRLAAYHNARKAGATVDQAAYLAKNLTVNFNRGGTNKSLANSWFLFYNASLQGSHIMFNAISRSKKVQGVMAGVIAAGYMSDIVNSLISDEDDDGRLLYDKLPDYVLHRNIVFFKPGENETKSYGKFPMPYGFNAFFNLGRVLSKLTRGGYLNSWEAAGDAVMPMIDSFNPLGGTNSLLNFVAPTVLDPIVDLGLNKDFTGRNIKPNDPNPYAKYDQPDSQKYWNSTAQPFKSVAEWMNQLTGGSEFKKGGVDVSPEQIEYIYDYALGGVGKFAIRVGQLPGTVDNMIAGDWDNVSVNAVPVARQLWGNVSNREDVEVYIKNSQDVLTSLNEFESLRDLGRIEEAKSVLKNNKDNIRLGQYFKKVDRELAKVRRMEKDIRGKENLSDEVKEKYLKKYREMKSKLMVGANKLYFSSKD